MRSSQDSAARHRDVLAACTPAAWEAHFGSDDPVVAGIRPLAPVSERRVAERTPTNRTDTGQPLRRRGARYGARSLGRRLALTGALAVLVTAGALGGTAQAALPGVAGDVAGTATAAVQQVAPAQPAAPATDAAAPVTEASKPVADATAPVTQAVTEATKPVAEAAAPVTQKVAEAADAAARGYGSVALLGTPFWYSDLVLAGRFDVGVGSGGKKLDGPSAVLGYLFRVAGDFTVEHARDRGSAHRGRRGRSRPGSEGLERSIAVTAARYRCSDAGVPAWVLRRVDPPRIVAPDLRVPVLRGLGRARAIQPTRWKGGPSRCSGSRPRRRRGRVAGHHGCPLYKGEPRVVWRRAKRLPSRAGSEGAKGRRPSATNRCTSVGLGAGTDRSRACREPTRSSRSTRCAEAKSLGHGVWVFDASDTNNFTQQMHIPLRYPSPASDFEARVFGPFLVIRTRRPTVTSETVPDRLAAGRARRQVALHGRRGREPGHRGPCSLEARALAASRSIVSWWHGASSNAARPDACACCA